MGKSGLEVKILMEMEALIARSCEQKTYSESTRKMHQEIIRRYFNALDAVIDYTANMVSLVYELPEDDPRFQQGASFTQIYREKYNYEDLVDFLRSCLKSDTQSLACYMRILRQYGASELPLVAV